MQTLPVKWSYLETIRRELVEAETDAAYAEKDGDTETLADLRPQIAELRGRVERTEAQLWQ